MRPPNQANNQPVVIACRSMIPEILAELLLVRDISFSIQVEISDEIEIVMSFHRSNKVSRGGFILLLEIIPRFLLDRIIYSIHTHIAICRFKTYLLALVILFCSPKWNTSCTFIIKKLITF